jgi:hypothetical protein
MSKPLKLEIKKHTSWSNATRLCPPSFPRFPARQDSHPFSLSQTRQRPSNRRSSSTSHRAANICVWLPQVTITVSGEITWHFPTHRIILGSPNFVPTSETDKPGCAISFSAKYFLLAFLEIRGDIQAKVSSERPTTSSGSIRGEKSSSRGAAPYPNATIREGAASGRCMPRGCVRSQPLPAR